MINIKVSRSENGSVCGFSVKGHSGYAESGSDIICAAVSALCYTAAGYFDEAGLYGIRTEFEEGEGYMKLEVVSEDRGENMIRAETVMEAWLTGIKQIRESYGGKYLRIRDL